MDWRKIPDLIKSYRIAGHPAVSGQDGDGEAPREAQSHPAPQGEESLLSGSFLLVSA
jgi:hypothetical protein